MHRLVLCYGPSYCGTQYESAYPNGQPACEYAQLCSV
jgi:hypothetical protein